MLVLLTHQNIYLPMINYYYIKSITSFIVSVSSNISSENYFLHHNLLMTLLS